MAHCPAASRHQAPGNSCQCGLYAYHPGRRSATEVFPDPNLDLYSLRASGLVEAWGRVEVHLDGFRAQYARPLALILPRALADGHLGGLVRAIARAHRAEVLVLGDPRQLAEHCRAHDLGMERATVAELLRAVEEPAERRVASGSGSGAIGAGAGRSPSARSAWDRIVYAGVMVAGGIWFLIVAAFCVLVAFGLLKAIIDGFGDDGPRSATARGRSHLEVVDQAPGVGWTGSTALGVSGRSFQSITRG